MNEAALEITDDIIYYSEECVKYANGLFGAITDGTNEHNYQLHKKRLHDLAQNIMSHLDKLPENITTGDAR